MQVIKFIDDSHTYWHGPLHFTDGEYDKDVRFDSVSRRIQQFVPDFEEHYWLTHKTLEEIFGKEYKKNYGRMCGKFGGNQPPKEAVFKPFLEKVDFDEYDKVMRKFKDMWKYKNAMANRRGTAFHDMMERKLYEQGFAYNDFDKKEYKVIETEKIWDNQSVTLDLSELEDGCYLELLLFDIDNEVAGQADKIFVGTNKNQRYIDVFDYKTNEKKPNKKYHNNLRPPLEHMTDSKLDIYTLQMSTYGRMLEKNGFKVRNLAIDYYKNYDINQRSLIPLTYSQSEADVILTKH